MDHATQLKIVLDQIAGGPICSVPSDEQYAYACSHILCKRCIERVNGRQSLERSKCPTCGTPNPQLLKYKTGIYHMRREKDMSSRSSNVRQRGRLEYCTVSENFAEEYEKNVFGLDRHSVVVVWKDLIIEDIKWNVSFKRVSPNILDVAIQWLVLDFSKNHSSALLTIKILKSMHNAPAKACRQVLVNADLSQSGDETVQLNLEDLGEIDCRIDLRFSLAYCMDDSDRKVAKFKSG